MLRTLQVPSSGRLLMIDAPGILCKINLHALACELFDAAVRRCGGRCRFDARTGPSGIACSRQHAADEQRAVGQCARQGVWM